jgi:hypothetical protein
MKTRNPALNCIMAEDPKIGGYTAFIKQFPNIACEDFIKEII